MSDALYTSYAEVLSLCQSAKDDLVALLSPDTGFAPRLREICREQLAELEDSARDDMPRELLDALRMEANTWGLLQAVLPARKTEPERHPHPKSIIAENPYTPTSTLAQAIMNFSPFLSELVVIREWLHETAPPPYHSEATTGYLRFTKHSIMQSLRTGSRQRDGLVTQMDPDAPNREEGRSLASDDAASEKNLSQALYSFVRAGRLDEAVEVCRKAHQPWRAASIRGSLLFRWRAIAHEQYDEDGMNDIDDAEGWEGNRRRRLWKSTCTRAALNTSLSDAERILYASLAPSPQTSTVLKSACRTWEDHLWAQISLICEDKQSSVMSQLGGGFWEDGLSAVDVENQAILQEDLEDDEELDEEWRQEAMHSIEALARVHVEDGPPANHAFHVSQLHIILDRTDALLEGFATGLQEGQYDPHSIEYPTMTRFFAHLCLYLQMIDIPVPPLATQVILEAYLQILEAAGQRDLIAMYAGALGDNAVERYAMFLTSLELLTDIDERRTALNRALEHGLNIHRVAVVTAERTIEKAFELLPLLKGPLPSIIAMQPPASEAELLLLRSIEWTTFMDETYETALEQATVILRYFLASGRVQLARSLLDMLPRELASLSTHEEHATEYLHYRQFFTIWEILERTVECQSVEASLMVMSARDTRTAWLEDYRSLIDQAHEQIIKLLTSDWMIPDVDSTGGDRRRRELARIRQIYIPELIIRLHMLLFTSRDKIPGNLKLALQLANIVADARYKLYEDFINQPVASTGTIAGFGVVADTGATVTGRKLGDYLGAIRQAVLAGLEGGGSDPFKIIANS